MSHDPNNMPYKAIDVRPGDVKPDPDLAEACEAMGLAAGTAIISCASHGAIGRTVDVFAMNNWENREGEITCEPSHPFCFGWCSPGLTAEEIGPDYCADCGSFIGEDGFVEKSKPGLCVECDEDLDPDEDEA